MRWIAKNKTIWNHVLQYGGHSADEGMRADTRVLMDGTKPAEYHMIANRHIPADLRTIGYDNMISHLAFMRQMSSNHEITIMPNSSDGLSYICAGVDVDIFPERTARTDFNPNFAALMFKVLWFIAHRDKWKQAASLANCGISGQIHMAYQLNIIAQLNVRSNNTIRPNFDAFPKLRLWVNDCGAVNVYCHDNSL